MTSINLTDAKARLSELVDQAEAGKTVRILRDGKAVAQLTPIVARKKAIDLKMLQALTADMPVQHIDAGDFVRAMRDGDRY